jgi:HTH-type transcriptional regulator, sugar sensing transcriptional regulator
MSNEGSASNVIAPLEALGFTLNEARAYAALLERGTQTGYEVGQHASIPRSAVYGVLRKLVERGAARSVAARDGAKERFVAVSPESVANLLGKRFAGSVQEFKDAAAQVASPEQAPEAFIVRGYERVLDEATKIVQDAREKLVISGWPRELASIANYVQIARKRGVLVVVFSHAALPKTPWNDTDSFSYGLIEAELESFWKHRLVVVGDDAHCLVGATEKQETDSAVVTSTRAIAELATSQVALDITLLAQRQKLSIEPVMAALLAERVGSLDPLLAKKTAR